MISTFPEQIARVHLTSEKWHHAICNIGFNACRQMRLDSENVSRRSVSDLVPLLMFAVHMKVPFATTNN
jgi:hypothetical protein